MTDSTDDVDWFEGDLEESPATKYFYELTQEELLLETDFVDTEKLKSIRQQGIDGKVLTDKQRWCLCFALAYHEESEDE